MNHIKGFTLIELVLVLILLGILAAAAIPRYLDLSNTALQASVDHFAGTLTSAHLINYMAFKAGSPAIALSDCGSSNDLLTAVLPSGYVLPPQPIGSGAAVTCTIVYVNIASCNYPSSYTGCPSAVYTGWGAY